MKKEYETPRVEKMEFNYSETVVASQGHSYRLYTDKPYGCHATPTDDYIVGDADITNPVCKVVNS